MDSAIRLQGQDVCDLTWDARVVAIRWDLLEWGVVFDLDVPVSEAEDAPMRRAWLAFEGDSEITITMLDARLPTGIRLTSSMEIGIRANEFQLFSCMALLPVFDGNVLRREQTAARMSIRAQGVTGIVSRSADRGSLYGLSLLARNALATDADLLSVLAGSCAEGGASR